MRHTFYTSFLTLALLLCTAPSQAAASKDKTYSLEQRFTSQRADEDDTTRNVTISVIPNREIPPYINYQITRFADKCTTSVTNASLVHVYGYYSDYQQKNDLPANYIVDFSPWADGKVKNKPCFVKPLCENGRCSLKGYSSTEDDRWTQTFDKSVSKWEPVKIRQNDQIENTYLNLTTPTTDCDEISGHAIVIKETPFCLETMAWRVSGLSSVRQKPL